MRILYMGTPDFAIPPLNALYESGENIIGVVTQTDKPSGRGYTLTKSPVKLYAEEKSIPVYQPKTLKSDEFTELLSKIAPELIVVAAYGKLLPPSVLNYPRYGCINVHGSLLPEYRGAAPIQRAIIDGKKYTGITTMFMDEGLDTGDILLSEKVEIGDSDNFETVHDKMAVCGARVLIGTLAQLRDGTLKRIKQDCVCTSYAAKIEKEDCLIDYTCGCNGVYNQIRGLSPFPTAFTHTPDGKLLKVTSAFRSPIFTGDIPGTVVSLDGGVITVECGDGAVAFTGVIPEGKKPMSAADYIRGRKINVGDILK